MDMRLGDLITLSGFVVAAFGFLYTMDYRTKSLEGGLGKLDLRLNNVDSELRKHTEILVQLAEQRQRIASLEAAIDRITRNMAA